MPEASILSNPFTIVGVVGFFIVVIIIIAFKKSSKNVFEPYIPRAFKDTIKDELKEKFETKGIKFKAKLYIGVNQIGKVKKYFEARGTFGDVIYDEKAKRMYLNPEGSVPFDIIHVMVKNKNFILALLGIKNKYFLFSKKDTEGKAIIWVDPLTRSITLPSNIDLIRYADTWHNSMETIEYVNNISLKAMLEEIWMHLENTPDKVAHMEQQQAKLERTARVLSEAEASKWEDRKKAGDTTIT